MRRRTFVTGCRRSRRPGLAAVVGAGEIPLEAHRGRDPLGRRRRHRHHGADDDGPRSRSLRHRAGGREPRGRQRRRGARLRGRAPARRPHHPARHAIAPPHDPAGQVGGEIRRVRGARARDRRSAGTDGGQVEPDQDRAGAGRRRQGAEAEGGRHAHRQHRPHLARGLRAQGGAAGAHGRAIPRRRRHRRERGERQPRPGDAQLRRGRVADQGRRRAAADGAHLASG